MSAASSLKPRAVRPIIIDTQTEEHPTTMPDTATKILFIAGFGPIDRDVAKSRALCRQPRHPFQTGHWWVSLYGRPRRREALCPVASFAGGAILLWH
jgi:hypothetical protein